MYDSKWEKKADKQDAQHKKDDEKMKSGKSFKDYMNQKVVMQKKPQMILKKNKKNYFPKL